MTSETVLEQKAFRTRIGYRFFEDRVDYSIRDSAGNKALFNVKYTDLPSKFEYRVFQPRRSALYLAAVRVMALALMVIVLSPLESWSVLGPTAVCGGIAIGVLTLIRQYREKHLYSDSDRQRQTACAMGRMLRRNSARAAVATPASSAEIGGDRPTERSGRGTTQVSLAQGRGCHK